MRKHGKKFKKEQITEIAQEKPLSTGCEGTWLIFRKLKICPGKVQQKQHIMIKEDDLFKIGFINKTHGIRGEVEFRFTDDIFDRVESDYVFIKLDGHPVPFFMEEYRFKSDESALMKFEDVDTAESAERLCEAEVFFPKSLVGDCEKAPLTWNYLTGFMVYEKDSGPVGEVMHVDASNPNILLTVKRKDGKEALLPFHAELLEHCDEKKRELTLKLPKGLITLND